jgi:hypothetical protein
MPANDVSNGDRDQSGVSGGGHDPTPSWRPLADLHQWCQDSIGGDTMTSRMCDIKKIFLRFFQNTNWGSLSGSPERSPFRIRADCSPNPGMNPIQAWYNGQKVEDRLLLMG